MNLSLIYEKKMKKSVPDKMREAAEIFEQRNKAYGDSYKDFGKVMMALFPNGITLSSEEEFTRFGIYFHVADKLKRYSANFSSGGHSDSIMDIGVYAFMLSEVDDDKKE